MTIGFVGLGMMGMPMVENLARNPDFQILAHDADESRKAAIDGLGANAGSLAWAASMSDLSTCRTVITMLPNSDITNAVIGALLNVLDKGATIIDMGSSHPLETEKLARRATEAGIALLDAPVSGAVAKARTGTLSIMVGGDSRAIDDAMPLLRSMGSDIIRTGAVGSAHAMKALNNYVYAAGLLAMSEATAIAGRMGLDLGIFAEVLNASSGRNVATETKLKQFVLPRSFNAGFQLRLQAKDLATADSLGRKAGVSADQPL